MSDLLSRVQDSLKDEPSTEIHLFPWNGGFTLEVWGEDDEDPLASFQGSSLREVMLRFLAHPGEPDQKELTALPMLEQEGFVQSIIDATKMVRKAQAVYFETRERSDLVNAKKLEGKLDKLLEQWDKI